MTMIPTRHSRWHWVGYALVWTIVISTGGGIVGALSFPLVGKLLLGSPDTVLALALSGARQLAFLAFIWAPGIGFVLAFNKAYLERQQWKAGTQPQSLSDQSN